ncbi:nucleotidyltransferase domain-containing protein [Hyphococcus luteus]|uniref:nucleotidyltransferase domain-containing protein n=1 Tax=Hyphococcus luteus TaxID=2058213 RepID=UPI0010574CA0|nr:nucleotidyltransferase [Marinicaulis flavus]
MAIPEAQLETWSHQGAKTQSASTYQSIKSVLEDPSSPFWLRSFDIFLQGSYGNDTNIYRDSDVDVVICLTSTYYFDIDGLNPSDKDLFESDRIPEPYGFPKFRAEVLAWLTKKFGPSVHLGRKAISVPGNGNRRDADVLVCAEHRDYRKYTRSGIDDFDKGVVFWTRDGKQIVNYPKQHRDNCTAKHQNTLARFKPNVRIMKNMRNVMLERDLIADSVAPSYFLEGMLSNVPNSEFTNSYSQTFLNAIVWLYNCDPNALTCVNDLHFLIRDGQEVCWNMADFEKTRSALWTLWDSWSGPRRQAI